MNLIYRITSSLTGHISQLATHIENHEAIVDAALKETRTASAKAKVRLSQLRKEGEVLRQKAAALHQSETLWSERAVTIAEKDRQQALECIQRRNGCRSQMTQIAEMLARHDAAEREVSASVSRIETRLTELTQQRSMMRSRHSAADALRIVNRIEGNFAYGVDDVFDRWEMRIAETEYETGTVAPVDSLELGFLKEEEKTQLDAELDALLAGNKTDAKE